MKKKILQKTKKMRTSLLALGAMSLMAAPAMASETGTLELNFDFTEMFSWAQVILDAMMPVLYITLGIGLAFIIISALKSAFR